MDMRQHTSGETKMSRFIDTKDVAKLIRRELKVFKGTKFTVRISRYAGGSSIRVSWTDGPTDVEVNRLIGHFHGSTFDGMIDLKSYHDSDLDGELVHFGNCFLFTERTISIDLFMECRSYAARFRPDVYKFPVSESDYGDVRTGYLAGHEIHGHMTTRDASDEINKEIRITSAWPVAQLIDHSRF